MPLYDKKCLDCESLESIEKNKCHTDLAIEKIKSILEKRMGNLRKQIKSQYLNVEFVVDKYGFVGDIKIKYDRVYLRNAKLPNPEAVRYAWKNNPKGPKLYNSKGLPASPFLVKNSENEAKRLRLDNRL